MATLEPLAKERASLEGRVVVVTGAGQGLGAELCRAFREAGSTVLPVDLTGADCLHVDVRTAAGNRRIIEVAKERFGRLDVLVLNAGVQHVAPIQDFSVRAWDRVMDTTAKGAFLGMRAAWAELTSRPGGRIIATASGSSFRAEPYKAAYVASKHALLGLVRVAALEAVPYGLTVNAVAPGWMQTSMVEEQIASQTRLHGETHEAVMSRLKNSMPGGRFVETEEVSSVFLFLAGGGSKGINGACIAVDLGKSA